MKTLKFKQYQTELINGNKGTINIPMDMELKNIIQTRQFIKDAYSETFVRSNAIVKFEYVGIHEAVVKVD